jgi:hypothetical protein
MRPFFRTFLASTVLTPGFFFKNRLPRNETDRGHALCWFLPAGRVRSLSEISSVCVDAGGILKWANGATPFR